MAKTKAIETRQADPAVTDVPGAVARRVATLRAYYRALGIENTETFLSESLNAEGIRSYESLWLISRDAIFEAALAEDTDDEIDGVRMRAGLIRWVAKSRNYDFVEATADSRLQITLWFADELYGELKATGANCDRLRALVTRYVVPELGE